jgi:hypothetical protein
VVRAERAEGTEFATVVSEALRRLAGLAGREPAHWERLTRLALYWAVLRRPRAEWEPILEAIRRTQDDAELEREMESMAEQVELTWEEELLQRGESRGRLRAYRRVLRQLIKKKFGSVPAELERRIDAADEPRLEAALGQLLSAASLDDVSL